MVIILERDDCEMSSRKLSSDSLWVKTFDSERIKKDPNFLKVTFLELLYYILITLL